MLFAVAGFVHQFWNPPAIIRAADIHHSWPQRAHNGVAIIQKLLGRPKVSLLGHAIGIKHAWPEWIQSFPMIGREFILARMRRKFTPLVCNIVPIARFDRVEKFLDLWR